jgi:multicomponent Na+:H+ antiporter subunit B
MDNILAFTLLLMIAGSVYLLHARDLLSAVVAYSIVGFGLVICFMLLRAPDLAIIQLIIETVTLIIMIAVILGSSREELVRQKRAPMLLGILSAVVLMGIFAWYFMDITSGLPPFGEHVPRMSQAYLEQGPTQTGSANMVTSVVFDFRGYDTLGEATILFTAAIGVLTVLRLRGRKQKS